MNQAMISAKLFAPDLIKALIYTKTAKEDNPEFVLIIDHKERHLLPVKKIAFQFGTNIYDLQLPFPLTLGRDYQLVTTHYGKVSLDVSLATTFPNFDEEFFYEGDDLGAVYTKNKTTFTLWAPLASQVYLKLNDKKKVSYHPMEREEKGIYRLSIAADLDGVSYLYVITNNGITSEVPDPYAKATLNNMKASVVYNPNKVKISLNASKLPPFKQMTDAIIYETSIRDMTSDKTTDIVHKGLYLGMIEKGRTSRCGHPAGFDYIARLGITHLQLMPVLDFVTLDEDQPFASYNWGYDPGQYFVPEGAYASDLDDPYSRIRDFKKLVAAYHRIGIRITLDVVYNHVYDAHFSILEQVVPNYYFRLTPSGKKAEGTGCGNEVASERPMVRKLIVDSVIYWVEEYGIDGFRFDLMGVMDLVTMQQIEAALRKRKPEILLYGEGWNMGMLPEAEKASHDNADKLPTYAFFNDSFRDIVKGPTADQDLSKRGYLLGNPDYRLGFKFAYLGSALDLIFPRRFASPRQSINYVECHDNATLIDKLQIANSLESESMHLKRLKLNNAVTMLAFGIPFFHRGQEIGVSKFGDTNSYRSGDRVNQFAYVLLENRSEMVDYFISLTKLRKDCPFLREDDPDIIEKMIEYEDLPEGGLLIDYVNLPQKCLYRTFKVFINIANKTIFYELPDYEKVIFNNAGYVEAKGVTYNKNLMIPPLSLIIVGLRADDFGAADLDTKNS